ncbi:MAG: ribbon-helix-helix protein, CopG family [Nevskiaceae bacterium]
MGTRTVRLDEETERILQRLRRGTGLSISEVLKRGVRAYSEQGVAEPSAPYEVFRKLELGKGGYAKAPAREAKRAIRKVIARQSRK